MYPLAFSLCCLGMALSLKLAIGVFAITPLALIAAQKCVCIFYMPKAVMLGIFLDIELDCRSDPVNIFCINFRFSSNKNTIPILTFCVAVPSHHKHTSTGSVLSPQNNLAFSERNYFPEVSAPWPVVLVFFSLWHAWLSKQYVDDK